MSCERQAAELSELHFLYSKELLEEIFRSDTQGEERVLTYLFKKQEPALSGELSHALRMTSGRMANILKALEKKKYVTRLSSRDDRRKVLVYLTEAGTHYIQPLYQQTLLDHQQLLEQMGESDATEFLRLIRKAIQIAQKK